MIFTFAVFSFLANTTTTTTNCFADNANTVVMQRSNSLDSGLDRLRQMSLDDEEQNRGNAPFNTFYSTTASEPWFPSGSRTGLWLETSQITPELNESHANDSHASPSDAKTGSSLLDVARQCTGMTVDQKELIVSSQKELRKKYPTLGLSGKIISANFHIPYDVSMSCDGEWVSCVLMDVLYSC